MGLVGERDDGLGVFDGVKEFENLKFGVGVRGWGQLVVSCCLCPVHQLW